MCLCEYGYVCVECKIFVVGLIYWLPFIKIFSIQTKFLSPEIWWVALLSFKVSLNYYWIKYVSWEYSCDGEYLEEFNKRRIVKHSYY